jgi:hypothetical protein
MTVGSSSQTVAVAVSTSVAGVVVLIGAIGAATYLKTKRTKPKKLGIGNIDTKAQLRPNAPSESASGVSASTGFGKMVERPLSEKTPSMMEKSSEQTTGKMSLKW